MSLHVSVEPARFVVVPGTPVELTVTVLNEGATAVDCTVRAVGLEPAWVEGATTASVASDAEATFLLTVTLPAGYPPGDHLVGIEAQAGVELAVADVVIEVDSLEALDVRLSPNTVRGGWRGRFRVNIRNSSDAPVTVRLTGRGEGPADTPSDLNFRFKPEEVTLRPGDRTRTKGWVTGPRHVIGAPRRHAITITAQGRTSPRYANGAFTQRAILSGNLMRIVGIVCILAIWAATLSATVSRTSNNSRNTAAEASAVVPGEAGDGAAGGTSDASGSDPSNGSGTEESVAPAAGASIAGQVKGPIDPSGINVKLRPVALADSLPENMVLASFTEGEETGKESVQTLRRDPESAVGSTSATVTDASGRWAFGGLRSPANYELTFAKAGFGERTYVVSVDDESPEVALDVDMVAGTGALSGKVVDANGPLGGVDLTVTDGTVTFKTSTPTTGEIGTWSVEGLTTPGTYLVTATRRGYGAETTAVELGNGESKAGVDLTMVAGVGSLAGKVTGAGVPQGGLLITATDGKTTLSTTTLTDEPVGSWAIPQLPIPGDYTVTVGGDGWITQTLLVSLKGNQTGVDFDLVRTTATIVGTVTGPAGPLAATGITLSQDKPLVKTLSAIDPAGSFELTGLLPGTYVLLFDRADYKSQSVSVTVASGERKSVAVTMVAQASDTIPKDAAVTGVVRDSTTASPVNGAQVVMNGAPKTTDANGSFVFDKLPPGTYDITFTHATHQKVTRTVRIGAASNTALDITMPPFGTLQGLVTDLTATAISGVTVKVENDPTATGQAAFTPITTTTNATGQYTFLNQLPTGKYIATFTKSSYQERTRNFESTAGTTVTADIQLIELGTVLGTIQEPASGLSGGFQPLNDVSIQIDKKDSNGVYQSYATIADADGTYSFSNLQPGNYRVTASKGGYNSTTKVLDDVKLRDTRDGSVILNGAAQQISGTVKYTDSNGNVQNVTNATITGTIVTGFNTLTVFPYIQPQLLTITMTTNGSGVWSVANASPATTGQIGGTSASFKIVAPGFTDKIVSVSAPDTNGDANVVLSANPRDVSGLVRIQSAVTTGNANVNVTLSGGGLSTPRTINFPTLSNDGSTSAFNFTSPGLAVGTYTLAVSATGYKTNTNSSFAVAFGSGAVSAGTLTLNKLGSITQTVTSGGSALSGATVTLKTSPGLATVSTDTTNNSGQVSFTGLDPGNYQLDVTKTGYSNGSTGAVTLAAGATLTPADVVMARFSTLTVALKSRLDATAPALGGATVTVTPQGGGTVTAVPETGTAGTYQLLSLAPGSYDLKATATGHVDGSTPITAVAGTDLTPTFELLQTPKIKVTVQSSANSGGTVVALSGATVTIRTSPGNVQTSTGTSDGSGFYAVGSASGDFTATVSAAGHDTLTSSVFTATAGTTVTPTVTLLKHPTITITAQSSANSGGTIVNLAGASVTITRDSDSSTAASGTTNGSGVFTATPAPGAFTVTITSSGHNNGTANVTTTAGGANQTPTVTLLKHPSITVTAQSSAGGTLSGATVTIKTSPGGVTVASGTTDGSGLFTATPTPGSFSITVSASSHDDGSGSVTTTAGAANQSTTVTLNRRPLITVTARSSANNGGTIVNLAGASVTIKTSPGGVTVASGTTDGSGVFSNGPPPGDFTITVTASGHDDGSGSVTTTGGGADQPVTVTLLKHPTVTVDVDSLDAGTPGALSGATVTVTKTVGGAAVASGTSNGSGLFTFTPTPDAGGFTVTATATGHESDTDTVTTTAGGANPTVALVLNKLPSLEVTVNSRIVITNGPTTDSLLTTATVTATCTATCSIGVVTTLTHQGSGLYRATSLPSGSYTVDVTAVGHDAGTDATVVIAGGGATQTRTINLAVKKGTITGTVRKTNNTVIQGVTISAQVGGVLFTSTATTDVNGVFTLSNVPPVTWSLTYQKTTFSPLTVSVTVPKGDNVSVSASAVLVELGGTISGKTQGQLADPSFTDTLNNPAALSGTVVNLVSVTSGITENRQQTVQNDGSNNFVYGFSDLPAADYELTFSKANYQNRVVTVTVGVAQVLNRTDTLVAKPGDIQVTVTDSSSAAGVSGAGLRISSPLLSGGLLNATTNGSGVATFSSVPPTSYTLSVPTTPAGYFHDGNGLTPALVVALGNPPTLVTRAFTMDPVGTVSGTASKDDGAGGAAASGITVALSAPGGFVTRNTTSAALGAYSFANVPPRTDYTVTFSLTGYTSAVVTPVTVTQNNTTTVNGTVVGMGTASGTVTIDTAGVTTTPAGTDVALSAVGGFVTRNTTTNGSGVYTFSNVPVASNYTLTFTKANHVTVVTNNVAITHGNTTTTNATLVAVGAIDGTVSKDLGGVISTADGVSVALSHASFTTRNTTTAGGGLYSFANVPTGTNYTLTFTFTNHADKVVSNVSVATGATTTVNTTVIAIGAISGTVTKDQSGVVTNASGANVQLTHASRPTMNTTTAADGTYTLTSVPVDTNYTLTFTLADHSTVVTNNVSVTIGTTTTGKDALLIGQGTLSGITSQADDTNPAVATNGVTVALSGGPASPANQVSPTNGGGATGNYAFTNLRAGTYTVTFSRNGYVSDVYAGVVVTTGQTTTRHGTVNKMGSVSGTVSVDDAGSPNGALVTLKTSPGGATVASTTVDGTGVFSFSNVPAGDYTLTYAETGYTTFTSGTFTVAIGQAVTGRDHTLVHV